MSAFGGLAEGGMWGLCLWRNDFFEDLGDAGRTKKPAGVNSGVNKSAFLPVILAAQALSTGLEI
jgi:hypothetical protein